MLGRSNGRLEVGGVREAEFGGTTDVGPDRAVSRGSIFRLGADVGICAGSAIGVWGDEVGMYRSIGDGESDDPEPLWRRGGGGGMLTSDRGRGRS